MSETTGLLKPEECAMLLVDLQAGLGFGVESMLRQVLIHNAVALARTAVAFKVPVPILKPVVSQLYCCP
jgi:nicotinamidase-related amidase